MDTNQKAYWDKVADEKVFTHPVDFKLLAAVLNKDHCILDFGCGYGRTCDDLMKMGYKNVIGIDFSKKMIQRGRRDHPHLDLRLVKDTILKFDDASFDAVLLFAVLTCIPIEEEQVKLITQIKKVLKPGGILYISDLLLQNDERNLKRYSEFKQKFGKYGIFELPEGVVLRHHSIEWIRSLTSEFKELKIKNIDFITMNRNIARGFQYLCKQEIVFK